MADEPTTEYILKTYVSTRLKKINRSKSSVNIEKILPGLQWDGETSVEIEISLLTEEYVKRLNYLRETTEVTNLLKNACCLPNPDEGYNEKCNKVLRKLFRDKPMSWSLITAFVEFCVMQMQEKLAAGKEKTSYKIFQWLLEAFKSNRIGSDGETINEWILLKNGWGSILKHTKDEGSSSTSKTSVNNSSHIFRTSNNSLSVSMLEPCISQTYISKCSCGNEKNREAGIINGKCDECSRYWCLVGNCTEELEDEAELTRHINDVHFYQANPNQCVHCGAYKMRSNWIALECPACGAYWCGKGTCNFETRVSETLLGHSLYCEGRTKELDPALERVQYLA